MGTHTLTYTVTDFNSDTDSVTFDLVIEADTTPVLPTIPLQTVEGGASVLLTLPPASSGNAPLAYALSGLPDGLAFAPATRRITGTAPTTSATHTLTYTVTDAENDQDQASVRLYVDTTPALAVEEDKAVAAGATVSITLGAASSGNAPLTYTLSGLPTGLAFNANNRTITGTAPTTLDTHELTYTVADAENDQDSVRFDLTVEEDTQPTLAAEEDRLIGTEATVSITLDAASSGNAPLTYALSGLPTGLTFDPATRTIEGTAPTTAGRHTLTYTVTDANGDTASRTFDLTIGASPVLADEEDRTVVSGQSIVIQLDAVESGNAPLTYSLTGLPNGLMFTPTTRFISGRVSVSADTTYTLTYRVTDAQQLSDEVVFDLTIERDTRPRLAAEPNHEAIVGTPFDIELMEATGGNAPLTYSLSFSPSWVSFDPETRRISGSRDSVSGATIGYRVDDADDDYHVDWFVLYVRADTQPTLSAEADKTAVAGATASITLGTATSGNAPLTYTLSGLPDGLSFDADNRRIHGTAPATTATHALTYTATDANSDVATRTFNLVIEADTQPALSVVEADRTVVGGEAVSITLGTATSGNAPLTYSLAGLPDELTFTEATRRITGTPVDATDTHALTYTVTDRNGDVATRTFNLVVEEDVQPTLSAEADRTVVGGEAVSITLGDATSGNAPLVYALSGLPDELTFDDGTRTITGTPVDADDTHTLTYTVTDRNGDVATRTFNLVVEEDVQPALAAEADRTVVGGEAVSITLGDATSGNAPLVYALSGLPDELTFDDGTRTITGTPVDADDTHALTYTVTDRNGDQATQTFDLVVEEDVQPALAAEADRTVVGGTAVSITLDAASSGNAPLTYTLDGLPNTLAFDDGTRTITGTPADATATHTLTYTVTDANSDVATRTFDLEVVRDTQPALRQEVDRTVVGGTTVNIRLRAATSGNAPLTYSLAGLPTGLSFNPNSRRIRGTAPTTANTHELTYDVADANSDTDSVTFDLVVEADTTPVLSAEADRTVVGGEAVSITLGDATSGNAPLTYTLTGLPNTLAFDADTLTITGTPADADARHALTYRVTDRNGDVATRTFNLVVEEDVQPTLSAEADRTVVGGEAVSITLGDATSGNAPLTYALSGLPDELTFTEATRRITGTPAAQDAMHDLTYSVTDANGDTDSVTFDLVVEADTTPVLSAEADRTVVGGEAVSITLGPATLGNEPLAYTLTGLPNTLTFDDGTRTITGTPADADATHALTYRATDRDNDQATRTFNLVVEEDVQPTLSTEADRTVVGGTAVSITLDTATSGNAPLTYALTGLPNTLTFDDGTRTITGTPADADATHALTYRATDANGDTDSVTFNLRVVADAQPTLSAEADRTVVGGTTINIRLGTGSSGNAPLVYALAGLPTGLSFNPNNRRITGTAPTTGATHALTYTVTDANNDVATRTFNLVVEADTTPYLPGLPRRRNVAGQAVRIQMPSATGGNAPLTYRIRSLPNGSLSFDQDTLILTGTLGGAQGITTFYEVTDRDGDRASRSFYWLIEGDRRPSLSSEATLTVIGGETANRTLGAATGGNTPLTYSLTGLPDGLAFNASNRRITGTARNADAGTHTLTYTVTDYDGDTATRTFSLVIVEDVPPVLSSEATLTVIGGEAVNRTLDTATSGNAPLTYSLTGLPQGLVFSAVARTITGTARNADAGTHTLTYTATDVDGDTDSVMFDLVIVEDVAPVLGTVADQTVIGGNPVLLTLPTATSGNAPLTYALAGLPTGLIFTAADRTITGTAPTTPGTHTLIYTATDVDRDRVSTSFSLVVLGDVVPVLSAEADRTLLGGTEASITLQAATGGNAPLTYALAGLPDGLAFDADSRTITGTAPNVTRSHPLTYTVTDADNDQDQVTFILLTKAVYSVTYTVTDADNDQDQVTFDMVVEPDVAPQLAAERDRTLLGGTEASITLQAATGGNEPLTYSLTGLPDGIVFDADSRTITGTVPNSTADHPLTYAVRDANDDQAQVILILTVTADTTPQLAAERDRTLLGGLTANITLQAATGGNAPLTYSLVGLPMGMTFDPATRRITGTVPNSTADYPLTYAVRDREADTTQVIFNLSVVADTTPQLAAEADRETLGATPVSITLGAATGGNEPLTYALSGLPEGMTFDPASRTINGAAPNTTTTYPLTYTVTDNDGDRASQAFNLVVTEDRYPQLADEADRTLLGGTEASITLGTATGGDAPLAYTLSGLPDGLTFDPDARTITGTVPNTTTTYILTYTVTDNDDDQVSQTFSLIVEADTMPQLADEADRTLLGGTDVDITLAPAQEGNTPLTYTLTGLPDELSFDADTRTITGTPPNAMATHTLAYQVVDNDMDRDEAVFDLVVVEDTQPTLAAERDRTLLVHMVGPTVNITLGAATGGNEPLTYTLDGLPTGLSFDPASRTITGDVPNITDTYTLTYTVTDNDDDQAQVTFDLVVEADTQPVLVTEDNRTLLGGTAVDITLQAATGGQAPLAYTISGLPDELTFTAATRRITGTVANSTVTHTLTYTVTDNDNDQAQVTFSLVVEEDTSPVLDDEEDRTLVGGAAVSVQLAPAQEGNAPLTYTISGLPEGLTFNDDDRTITGTAPTEDSEDDDD